MKTIFLYENYKAALRQGAAMLLLCFLLGCEKDDICVDGDTPLLIIRFYDKDNPDMIKPVSSLRVTGSGMTAPLPAVNRVTTDSIAIPLSALANTSVFSFISNSEDDGGGMETGNTDVVHFNYDTFTVFVSRACGYVANYENLTVMVDADADNWITSTTVINPTVTDGTKAHLHIFH